MTMLRIILSIPQGFGAGIIESLLIANDIRVSYRGQNTDLIDCVVYFSRGEVDQFYFLEGIDALVDQPPHLVDTRIGSFSKFFENLEVSDRHFYYIIAE